MSNKEWCICLSRTHIKKTQEQCSFIHDWKKKKSKFSLHLHFLKMAAKASRALLVWERKTEVCVGLEGWQGRCWVKAGGEMKACRKGEMWGGSSIKAGWEGQTCCQLTVQTLPWPTACSWSALPAEQQSVITDLFWARRNLQCSPETSLLKDQSLIYPGTEGDCYLLSSSGLLGESRALPSCDTATRELWSCFLHASLLLHLLWNRLCDLAWAVRHQKVQALALPGACSTLDADEKTFHR